MSGRFSRPRVGMAWLVFVTLSASAALAQSSSPAAAPAFPERRVITLAPHALTDRELTRLLSTLDALLARSPGAAAWGVRAEAPLGEFVKQLQSARLTPAQQQRVLAHLDLLARQHRQDVELIRRARTAVRVIGIGKTAPEIAGPDLDGRDLKLSSYSGKVVLLVFSAEWCGICRTQEPYQRFLLDQYRNWPFAIVSVETGATQDSVKRFKSDARLKYTSWWDGAVNGHLGPIASAWNVTGFPRTFLIDARGVIRFADLRDEDLLKGVRQLLNEMN